MKVKKILVSQPPPTSEKSPYFDIIEKYGVKIDFRPFIKVEPVTAKEFRQQKVAILDHTAVVFTSKTGIDHFFRICQEMRITVSESMKYFCVSESVALYLQKYIQYRKRKVFYGATGKLADLFSIISKHLEESYLVVLSDVHNEEILLLLEKNKVQFHVGIMYRTVSNEFSQDEEFNYDLLIFFSPQGVASLLKNFPNFEQGEIKIATFGATTAQAIRDAGLQLEIEAPRPEAPSMTAALELFLKENHKNNKK
ncbi:uroporphyrinogen-III synthase [Microbacter margulisiae]|uniref:Uroporphyrinogen-III synthase n=1 Tax=Microbacter margulisiae TaxID=1350067 RepID=A0A7W5H3E7_9PORP|nr:uroporphyrinogen-III synthase [Microbacter margulisiae]MBB3188391.1 uroporphyrinogen-III synthase [Microbacter margulisiae]